LWARLIAEGIEYFWIDTALSAAQLALKRFDFEKLPSPQSRQSRSIEDWFGLLQEITRLPLVAELLTLFGAGLLPISVAAPLGEKERVAAFAAPQPLAWIELYAPLLAHVCALRPEKCLATIAQRASATCCALCTVATWTTRQLGTEAGPTLSSTDSCDDALWSTNPVSGMQQKNSGGPAYADVSVGSESDDAALSAAYRSFPVQAAAVPHAESYACSDVHDSDSYDSDNTFEMFEEDFGRCA
jgi:hypothetical protein